MSERPGPGRTGDSGESSIQYMGLLLLIASIVVALISSAIPGQVSGGVEGAVCKVGEERCAASGAAPGSPAPSAPGSPAPRGGSAGGAPAPEGGSGGDDRYWDCGWFGQDACDMVQGFGWGIKGAVTDTWDGLTYLGCMVHLCSHDAFKENWGGLRDGLVYTFQNPGEAFNAIVDDWTKEIRRAWKDGHKGTAVAITLPTLLGKLFGAKGLDVPETLAAAEKWDKLFKALQAAREAGEDAARRARDAARRGDVEGAEQAAEEALRAWEDAKDRMDEGKLYGRDIDAESRRAQQAYFEAMRAVVEARIRNVLLRTDAGSDLLRFLDENGIKIEYGYTYSRYDSEKKVAHINTGPGEPRDKDPIKLALLQAKMAEFIRLRLAGKTVDPTKVTRHEYQQNRLSVNVDSTLAQIKVYEQLKQKGVALPKTEIEWEIDVYRQAVTNLREQRKRDGLPPPSEAEETQAARDQMLKTFGQGRSYDEYGSEWDSANRQRP